MQGQQIKGILLQVWFMVMTILLFVEFGPIALLLAAFGILLMLIAQ